MRLARLLPLCAALLLVSCFSAQADESPPNPPDAPSAPSAGIDLDVDALPPMGPPKGDEQAVDIEPPPPTSSVALASGALRSVVERLQRGQTPGLGVDVIGTKIRVEVLHDLESSEIRTLIADLGGTVEGEVEGVLVQALVPFDRLVTLESHDGVQFVRPPLEANVPNLPPLGEPAAPQSAIIVGEEVAKSNADVWHAAGYTGAGVKVGIIDYFHDDFWTPAQAAGELPTPAGTFCLVGGTPCDIWTMFPGADHGQAVAEIVHEMAPGAQLYLATVDTTTDLQAAVDYFAGEGVDIISRSLTSEYDGPGDGTGPIATVMDNAVASGMVWFNSAGNNAGDGSPEGSYWRGTWEDFDADNWIEFAPGDERMGFVCWFINGVRWSDFGAASPTDYDVCVFDYWWDVSPMGCSEDRQTPGVPPLELDIPCNPGGDGVDYLGIQLISAGGGTAGDVLEFMTNGAPVEHWQNPYSASGPASDTASPGGLSIGAVAPPLGTDIAYYSAQGPTNDGLYGGTDRMKPDISAAAGVASYTYSTFHGTSASTPAAAGAAALIIEAGLASTPAEVKTYLLSNAAVDRGAPGPDNVFGEGELLLGSPPEGDSDGDGVPNDTDNCPDTPNPGQENSVHPGTPEGDHCEDPDGDLVFDHSDNCPDDYNLSQTNTDGHDLGDACDDDDDDDGYKDDEETAGGSDPLDAGSTPEVCDGIDNDGDCPGDTNGDGTVCGTGTDWKNSVYSSNSDVGVDEGFADNDGNGSADCYDDRRGASCLYDADGDTICNATDLNDDDSPNADPFTDLEENYMGTNKDAMCASGGADNDPLDNDADGQANILDYMAYFAFGELGTEVANDDQAYKRRLDLDADGQIGILDIMEYFAFGQLGQGCPYGL